MATLTSKSYLLSISTLPKVSTLSQTNQMKEGLQDLIRKQRRQVCIIYPKLRYGTSVRGFSNTCSVENKANDNEIQAQVKEGETAADEGPHKEHQNKKVLSADEIAEWRASTVALVRMASLTMWMLIVYSAWLIYREHSYHGEIDYWVLKSEAWRLKSEELERALEMEMSKQRK